MYPILKYHTTTNIIFSAEHFHNLGISSEEVREIIENIRLPHSGRNLYCRSAGINGNWQVEVVTNNPDYIEWIVECIERELRRLLNKRG